MASTHARRHIDAPRARIYRALLVEAGELG